MSKKMQPLGVGCGVEGAAGALGIWSESAELPCIEEVGEFVPEPFV